MSRKAQDKRKICLAGTGGLFCAAIIIMFFVVVCLKSFTNVGLPGVLQLSVLDPATAGTDTVKNYSTNGGKEKYTDLQNRYNTLSVQLGQYKKEIEELKKQNSELAADNIELQNTLKMAASSGIKPQNYTRFKGIDSRGGFDRGEFIGEFFGTAYTPSKDECGNNKGITNSGEPIIPGITVAVDSKYWPFGTVFYIKGLGYAIAMDTGSAIKGKYRFDFSVFNKKFAGTLGARYWDVYLVKPGKGYVESADLLKK